MKSITDFVTALAAQLAGVAPIYFGNSTKDLNIDLPVYWVYPTSVAWAAPQGGGQGISPRALYSEQLNIDIHCWAIDYDAADALKNAAITALRLVLSGANFRLVSGQWVDPMNIQRGATVVITLALLRAVPEMALTAPPIPNNATTVAINAVGLDATGAVFGDAILDSGETP